MTRKDVICALGLFACLYLAATLVAWEAQLGGIGTVGYIAIGVLLGLAWLCTELPYLEFRPRKRAKRKPLTMRAHRQGQRCKSTTRT